MKTLTSVGVGCLDFTLLDLSWRLRLKALIERLGAVKLALQFLNVKKMARQKVYLDPIGEFDIPALHAAHQDIIKQLNLGRA